ncbi:MAG: penicillin acylase family protein [Chromatiaceae bacterium]|nr:penicillin acylase family protein [Chromatiaceae bacterium]
MRSRFRQLLRFILLGLVAATLLGVGLVSWWVHRPHPIYNGTLAFSALEKPVTVRYGPHAVPSIQAETLHDMLFAQGFVVAAERFWQMDLLRRLAGGRLAALFGEGALGADRFYRTIGLPDAAQRSFDALEPRWQRLLQAYADGVNAYLSRARAGYRLPLEYQLLGLQPSPWQPQDSLLIGGYMAWLNSMNLREELVFLRLAQRLGTERALELFPTDQGQPAPADAHELPDYRSLLDIGPGSPSGAALDLGPDSSASGISGRVELDLAGPELLKIGDARAAQVTRPSRNSGNRAVRFGLVDVGAVVPPALAQALSNAWAVTGSRTHDGAALLANDPHLPAVMPGTWYELAMQAPGYQVAGVALPGVPWILIGHNADLAWGITAAAADTQDLFLERVSEDGARVLRPDGSWGPIAVRVERVAVAGQSEPAGTEVETGADAKADARTSQALGPSVELGVEGQRQIELPIRSTRHGVLIDELVASAGSNPAGLAAVRGSQRSGFRLALRLALDRPDRAFVGFYRLNTATTIAEARAAVEDLYQVSLSLLFAHRDGEIASQVSGLLPDRGRGSGTFPVPGWEPGYGWNGYRPFAQNPGITAPSDERLVSANNAIRTDDEDALAISHSWLAPFRAQRIEALLDDALDDGQETLDLAAMQQMQADRVSLEAAVYLSSLRRYLPAIRRADPEAAALAEARLLDWSGSFEDESQPAAFFVLLRSELYRALYADELGTDLELLMRLDTTTYGPLAETMYSDQSSFWDDIETPGVVEGPATIWARALRATAGAMRDAMPGEQEPTLAQLRQLTFAHAFDGQPLLGGLFNLGPIGRGGDSGTIDVAIAPPTSPRAIGNVASVRVVFAPAVWSQTSGTLPLGQSGHRFSRYRADQLDDWLNGRSHAWPWADSETRPSVGTLVLQPDPD